MHNVGTFVNIDNIMDYILMNHYYALYATIEDVEDHENDTSNEEALLAYTTAGSTS